MKHRAFMLIDLVALVGIAATVLSLSFVNLARFRELSKRLVCSTNLQGIGAVAQIYAQDNNDQWMVPPFAQSTIDMEGIDYLNDGSTSNDSFGSPLDDEGEVGWNRHFQSQSETKQNQNQGTNTLSVTRSFWMLVRSGDVHLQQFICPSSNDVVDSTEMVDLYYDFTGYQNISYGYQVPFGPMDTRPWAGADNRRIQAADKSPYYLSANDPGNFEGGVHGIVTLDDSPTEWRPYNSANHGGIRKGEGQNCLFPDGSVCFNSIPAVGVDNDNIYTAITQNWNNAFGENRIHGDTPHLTAAQNPYPGQDAFGTGAGRHSSTDTLLYP